MFHLPAQLNDKQTWFALPKMIGFGWFPMLLYHAPPAVICGFSFCSLDLEDMKVSFVEIKQENNGHAHPSWCFNLF
jgi:hypothetical protein